MKIALFGGSFNPPHNDHLKVINSVLEKKLVDEVWIIPCKDHPFEKELAPFKNRFEMLTLATEKIPYVKISDIENKTHGKSYSYSTVMELKKQKLETQLEISATLCKGLLRARDTELSEICAGMGLEKICMKTRKYRILAKEAEAKK